MSGRLLVQSVIVPHDVVVEITAVAKLQDEVELSLSIDNLVKADNVRMLDEFHAAHLLEEMGSRHFVQLGLVDHLDGHLFSGENMAG